MFRERENSVTPNEWVDGEVSDKKKKLTFEGRKWHIKSSRDIIRKKVKTRST